ncbi:MAG: winged helix DNA-binding domain-containing protein [Actinomycetota bacterium]
MPTTVLSLRQLNRATLARQMLLERGAVSVGEAVAQLVGLQAQQAMTPFVGLWSRVEGFRREDLAGAIGDRQVVKATLWRATLHLVTEADFRGFRSTMQPMLSAASQSINQARAQNLDVQPLVDAARRFLGERPRTFAELSTMLSELRPGVDVGAMRYAVRTHLPLIQVPIDGGWSYPGNPQFTLAESWLEGEIAAEDHLKELLFRYLAAFGPASATDFQTWSGLRLRERIDEFRPQLVVYRDEARRELFDLPEAIIPPDDTAAPVRLLPEYDNLLLAHRKRTRVIADEHRSRVYLPGLRVRSTFLVDGFVAGAWKLESSKTSADLVIEPFQPLSAAEAKELSQEAERLVQFLSPEARSHAVRFQK